MGKKDEDLISICHPLVILSDTTEARQSYCKHHVTVQHSWLETCKAQTVSWKSCQSAFIWFLVIFSFIYSIAHYV